MSTEKMTREWFQKQGAIGGRKAARKMTKEQKQARGRAGAAAREAKRELQRLSDEQIMALPSALGEKQRTHGKTVGVSARKPSLEDYDK